MTVSVQLVNETTKDIKTLKVGFDLPAFFSPFIWGIPHILRKQWIWAGAIIGFNVIMSLTTSSSGAKRSGEVFMLFIIVVIMYSIFGYFTGKKGQEVFAKQLLSDGYDFREPDSNEVKLAKEKWGIL